MTTETNALGEVYEWEFLQTQRKSWDEVDALWDSASTTRPWDSLGVEGGWTMTTNRTLSFGSNDVIHLTDQYFDTLKFSDVKLKNGGVVLSDVEFGIDGLSFTEFKERALNDGPVGYDIIRPLIPGEYTYKDAIVGLRMRSYSQDNTLGFEGAVLNVDVEDVIDKGQVTVTSTDVNNPTVVLLKKWYYNPPEELMFTITNFSEPCMVEVIDKTDKQFSIMLRSTIVQNRYVTGTVMWTAIGY